MDDVMEAIGYPNGLRLLRGKGFENSDVHCGIALAPADRNSRSLNSSMAPGTRLNEKSPVRGGELRLAFRDSQIISSSGLRPAAVGMQGVRVTG